MSIERIVNVTSQKQSFALARATFGIPLYVSAHTAFAGLRTRAYSAASELLADGFIVTDQAYLSAVVAFAQRPKLKEIRIGREEVGDASLTATMAAIRADDTDWYGFTHESQVKADILELAAWAATEKVIYGAQSIDSDIAAGTAANLAETLHDLGYQNTWLMVRKIGTELAADAWLARGLVADLDAQGGQITWAFKSLVGIPAETYTTTELNYLDSQNANYYINCLGRDLTMRGTMIGNVPNSSAPLYIDTQTTCDWLDCRLTEDLFGLVANQPARLPLSQVGIDAGEGTASARLQEAENIGLIQPGWELFAPEFGDLDPSDISLRCLGGYVATAQAVNSVQKIELTVNLTV